jgi:hypothetical protein
VAPSLVNQSASTSPVGPAPIIRTSLRVIVSSVGFGVPPREKALLAL